MVGKIKIGNSTIRDLEKIARLVFPMEIEAQLPIREIGDEQWVNTINIPSEYGVPEAYRYAENFDEFIKCLKDNGLKDFRIKDIIKEYDEAEKLFGKYKECQRRRETKECEFEDIEISRCLDIKCDSYGQPSRQHMYEWFSNIPAVAWHSHVTSEYGDIERLSRPSGSDGLILARRIAFQEIPIKAESITCTSENGKQKTRLFYLPGKKALTGPSDRREIILN